MRISDGSSDVCSSDLRDASGLGFAAHQLAQGESATAALQLVAPFVIEATAFVEDKKHLEVGIAKKYVRRFSCGGELVGAIGHVQPLHIGRGSCSERVCPDVSLSGVHASFKKKN